MVFIPRAGTLNKSNTLGCLAVGWACNISLGRSVGSGQPFHHHIGNNIRILTETEIFNLPGIIGLPTGCPDYRSHLKIDGFGLHVEIDRIIFAGLLHPGGVFWRSFDRRINHKSSRICHVKRQVSTLYGVHVEIEGTFYFRLAGGCAITAAGAVLVNESRI